MSHETSRVESAILMIALGIPALAIGVFLLSQDPDSLGSLGFLTPSITIVSVGLILVGIGYLVSGTPKKKVRQ